jgi:hypothetical protein
MVVNTQEYVHKNITLIKATKKVGHMIQTVQRKMQKLTNNT